MTEDLMYQMDGLLEQLDTILAATAVTNAITGIFGIITYILAAVALYALASRRGIRHAWLSWIPIGNLWILGSLADQYRYVVKHQTKNKRKALLTMEILLVIATIVCIALLVGSTACVVQGALNESQEDRMVMTTVGLLFIMGVLLIPMIGVIIARMIVRFMALYDVYRSVNPENAVLFLVLSILFPVTEAFFLFFNRKRDQGMVPEQPRQWQIPQDGYSYMNDRRGAGPEDGTNTDPWDHPMT